MEQKYRIIERIDGGGMAEVFLGRARAIHGIEKWVAIKRIHPHLSRNRQFVSMFLDEARLTVYLNHSNIVQVFDIARAGLSYFIVMEYVEGANVRTLMNRARERETGFNLEEAAYIVAQVTRGLAYAHERRDHSGRPLGIVHRDVSPPNVLVSYEGEIKIVDFGLAKAASQLEESDPDILKGKLGYMSPEQAHGHPVDPRSDLFAAGILLWEMLAGRRLFKGETDLATLEMVRAAEVPPLSRKGGVLPVEVDEVLARALAKDPKRRYQSARELESDLWSLLFSRGLKVTPSDVGAHVRSLVPPRAHERRASSAIDAMIQDEILRLVSIEDYELPEEREAARGRTGERGAIQDEVDTFDGSQPLRAEDLLHPQESSSPPRPVEVDPLAPILESDRTTTSYGHRPSMRVWMWAALAALVVAIGVVLTLRLVV